MFKSPRRRPSLEVLETRHLPATFGLPWPDPQHLTLSLMPDGTPVGGAPSTLNQSLNARMPTAAWRLDMLRAFQSWAVLGNINIGVVSDNGQAPGQPGPLQGNPGFGDIRIGARALSADTVALASPFDLVNNWSGDVLLNSQAPFGDGPQATENLFNAMLHEAGHVLGLPDNPADPTSAMFTVNTDTHTAPSPADAAAIQALYGVRQPDTQANDTFATASPLYPSFSGSWLTGQGVPAATVSADLSSLTDKDVYRVFDLAPDGFAVDLRTSGISLLMARLTVYNASGQALASTVATDPLNGDLALTVPGAVIGTPYYVKVEGAQPDVFGIGSYRLSAGQPDQARQALSATAVVAARSVSHETASPTFLKPQTPGTNARWPYLVQADLSNPAEIDGYSLRAGTTPAVAMLATVWESQPGGVTPRVSVFDGNHKPVAAQVVARDSASETVQVLSPVPGARYLIEVSAAATSAGGTWSQAVGGNYTLGVTFRNVAITSDTLASGTLSGAQNETFLGLSVNEAEVFHFDLSGGTTSDTAVSMTVFDASGHAVEYLHVLGGAGSATGDVVLPSGVYTVRILAATRTGVPVSAFHYTLLGSERSDPIGPSPVDPTYDPISAPPLSPTSPTSPPPVVLPPYSIYLLNPLLVDDYLIGTDPFSLLWLN